MKTKLVTIKNKFVNLVKNLVAKCKSINFKRNKKRYFLVSYSFSYANASGVGSVETTTDNGSYFNLETLKKEQIEHDDQIKNLLVTNVIELNKKDYEMYSSKESK